MGYGLHHLILPHLSLLLRASFSLVRTGSAGYGPPGTEGCYSGPLHATCRAAQASFYQCLRLRRSWVLQVLEIPAAVVVIHANEDTGSRMPLF